MKLNLREISGLALILFGLILIPAAWAFSRTLTLLSFFLIGIGGALFYTERVRKREEKMAKDADGTGAYPGTPMPTDIHNYTGWRSGGRRADANDGGDDVGGDGD